VTSRNHLFGLVAAEGARPVTLDLLSVAESRDLLANRIGADRVAAESHAVDEIITLSARLPLALAIVAARAAIHPRSTLVRLAADLRRARGGLDAFAGDDSATDVRAVFSWSYHTLSPAAARLFRLLGLHLGPDIGAAAAASLAGTSPEQVRPLLAELAGVHLVSEPIPGRFAFHDLLRLYATELAHALDGDDDRHLATHRLLDHYLHSAHAANRLLLQPHLAAIALPPALPGVTPEDIADDHQEALAWFTTEYPVLLAIIRQAATTGFDTHCWQQTWTLIPFLNRRGQWQVQAATQRTGLDAARRRGDLTGQAQCHRGLGGAYIQLARHDDAHTHLAHALDLFCRLADHNGQASAHFGLGMLFGRQGRHRDALDHARHALNLYRAAGHRAGQASALNTIGWYHAQLGDHRLALARCQQALTLHAEVGDRHGEAITWDSLGYAYHQLGHHQQAITCYRRAIDLTRELGDRYVEADTLIHVGDVHQAMGDADAARTIWQEALDILDEFDHPDADQVRARLDRLGQTRTPMVT
jgi:Tfp pilus assembly protein PilF